MIKYLMGLKKILAVSILMKYFSVHLAQLTHIAAANLKISKALSFDLNAQNTDSTSNVL